MGRATQGVRLINLEKRNDQIASVCKVNTEADEEEQPQKDDNDLETNNTSEEVDNINSTEDINN